MAEIYGIEHLIFEVHDQLEKMKTLETATNVLKESYEKGEPDNVKIMARQLKILFMETGLLTSVLSTAGQDLLSNLEKRSMTIEVSKTHPSGITVNQPGNDQVDGRRKLRMRSSQGGIELSPNKSDSPPMNTQEAKTALPVIQNALQGTEQDNERWRQENSVLKQKIRTGEHQLAELIAKAEARKSHIKELRKQLKDAYESSYLRENKEDEIRFDTLKKDHQELKNRLQASQQTIGKLSEENSVLKKQIQVGEQAYAELIVKAQDQKAYIKDLSKQLKEAYANFKRKFKEDEIRFDTLRKDHQELKHRWSKVAGVRFQNSNPDITDLSDPNRAMKLEGRFSALYDDDDWTDAFQAQTDTLKSSTKVAIQNLLDVLKKCYEFCNDVAEQQMDSLRMVFLHPVQDLCQTTMAKKDRPRIASKEDTILKDLRKQIGTQSTNEVKQQFIAKMSQEYKKSEESKKVMRESKVYFEKCAEICWMMVLHDPPLYMDMGVKPGDKVDLNYYRVYSNNGDKVDFLVWPPLHITGGGLLAKGVVEPVNKKK